jgi:metal-dependent amidase/aminoacylase/carboxypeptidase family protein
VSPAIDLARDVADVAPGVVALRRALHQRPALACEEVWTAG